MIKMLMIIIYLIHSDKCDVIEHILKNPTISPTLSLKEYFDGKDTIFLHILCKSTRVDAVKILMAEHSVPDIGRPSLPRRARRRPARRTSRCRGGSRRRPLARRRRRASSGRPAASSARARRPAWWPGTIRCQPKASVTARMRSRSASASAARFWARRTSARAFQTRVAPQPCASWSSPGNWATSGVGLVDAVEQDEGAHERAGGAERDGVARRDAEHLRRRARLGLGQRGRAEGERPLRAQEGRRTRRRAASGGGGRSPPRRAARRPPAAAPSAAISATTTQNSVGRSIARSCVNGRPSSARSASASTSPADASPAAAS